MDYIIPVFTGRFFGEPSSQAGPPLAQGRIFLDAGRRDEQAISTSQQEENEASKDKVKQNTYQPFEMRQRSSLLHFWEQQSASILGKAQL